MSKTESKKRELLEILGTKASIRAFFKVCPFSLGELRDRYRGADVVIWRRLLVAIMWSQDMPLQELGTILNKDHSTFSVSVAKFLETYQDKGYLELEGAVLSYLTAKDSLYDTVDVNSVDMLRNIYRATLEFENNPKGSFIVGNLIFSYEKNPKSSS